MAYRLDNGVKAPKHIQNLILQQRERNLNINKSKSFCIGGMHTQIQDIYQVTIVYTFFKFSFKYSFDCSYFEKHVCLHFMAHQFCPCLYLFSFIFPLSDSSLLLLETDTLASSFIPTFSSLNKQFSRSLHTIFTHSSGS